MPTIQHNVLAGSDLHEPKGVSGAPAGKVYVADGAGSGAWLSPYTVGWETVVNLASPQSLTQGVFTKVENDKQGNNSTIYGLPGRPSPWDHTTNTFNWDDGQYELGDVIDLYFTLLFDISAGSDSTISSKIVIAVNSGSEYDITMPTQVFKQSTSPQVTLSASMCIQDAATLSNRTHLEVHTDQSGDTVQAKVFRIETHPRNPVFV